MMPKKIAILVVLITFGLVFAGVVMSLGSAPSTWIQSNTSGFGDQSNIGVFALSSYDGHLYAGSLGSVGKLWRLDNSGWSSIVDDGFSNANNLAIDDLIEFDSVLYAGTINVVDGGQIWRSGNVTDWELVVADGFGDPTNGRILQLAEFQGSLYAGTWSNTTTHGAELWRSNTGNALDWTRVVTNGFDGDASNTAITSLAVYSNMLYAGTRNLGTGGEVWRSSDGLSWSQVNVDGFGTANNSGIPALAAFKGRLYASTRTRDSGVGADVWRCQLCDGSDWSKVVDNGFGNAEADGISALEVYSEHLFFVVGNEITGLEVWRSLDGATGSWEQVGFGGFGNSSNDLPYYDNSVTVHKSSLYAGTFNVADGGEIWQYLAYEVYLPIVIR